MTGIYGGRGEAMGQAHQERLGQVDPAQARRTSDHWKKGKEVGKSLPWGTFKQNNTLAMENGEEDKMILDLFFPGMTSNQQKYHECMTPGLQNERDYFIKCTSFKVCSCIPVSI